MPYINGRRYYEHRITATYYVMTEHPDYTAETELREAMARADIKHGFPQKIHIYSLNPDLHGEDR